MKTHRINSHIVSLSLLCIIASMIFCQTVTGAIVINEIMVNEPGSDVVLEWVELYNNGSSAVSLSDYVLIEAADSTYFSGDMLLQPAAFMVLSRRPVTSDGEPSFEARWGDSSGVWGDHPDEDYLLVEVKMSLKNSGDSVTLHFLRDSNSEVVSWSDSPPDGVSLERINPFKPNNIDNFDYCIDLTGSTPGRENSIIPPDFDLELLINSINLTLPAEKTDSLVIVGEVINSGLITSPVSYLLIYFDRDFSEDRTALDDLDSVSIPSLEPDSIFEFESLFYESDGRKSLRLELGPDSNSSNNFHDFYFAVGDFFTELKITEFLINPTDQLDCEWIELLNVTDYQVNIYRFSIGDWERTYQLDHSVHLEPEGRVLLCEDLLNFVDYYGLPDCPLVQPDGWNNFINNGDIIILINDLGRFSDTVRFIGSHPDNRSWELNEDSLSGNFEDIFYKSTDSSGSTPCELNSPRPLLPDNDLGFPADGLNIDIPPDTNSPVLVNVTVKNYGRNSSPQTYLLIYFDRDFSEDYTTIDDLDSVIIPILEPDSVFIYEISFYEPVGRKCLRLQLSPDSNSSNNYCSSYFAVGDFFTEMRISEFLVNPTDQLDCEWIELVNVTDYLLGIDGFAIGDEMQTCQINTEGDVAPKGRILLCEDSANFINYYGQPACPLVQPEGWNNFINAGDIIVLANDLGCLSDTVRFVSSHSNNVTWELDEDSASGQFKNIFYRSTDISGSTPCETNSTRASPPDNDLGFPGEGLIVTNSPDGDIPSMVTITVKNYGLLTSEPTTISIYLDADFDQQADQSEIIDTQFAESILQSDSVILNLEYNLQAGYYQIICLLPADADQGNNQINRTFSVGPLTGEIIITEFLADPTGDLECEWVECRNVSQRAIDLNGWSFGDSVRQYEFKNSISIKADHYVIITEDSLCFADHYMTDCPIAVPSGWSRLNNSGDKPLHDRRAWSLLRQH